VNYQLYLNKQLLKEGDFRALTALFNDLSGLNFAKGQSSNWLNKMSADESYLTYLNIMAKDFGVLDWKGELILAPQGQTAERVHLFKTHETLAEKNLIEKMVSPTTPLKNIIGKKQ